jgi:hypothetical protein
MINLEKGGAGVIVICDERYGNFIIEDMVDPLFEVYGVG